MSSLFKRWRVLLFVIILFGAISSIILNGVALGIDFRGGSLLQIQLDDVVSAEEAQKIADVISLRIDPSQTKDITIEPVGGEFLVVKLPIHDVEEISRIETLIKTQGVFESRISGETIFTGDDLVKVGNEPNFSSYVESESGGVEWRLQFWLSEQGARNFRDLTFHKCFVVAFDPATNQEQYDCEKTFFFIDRPVNSIVVMPASQFDADEQLFLAGSVSENIPQGTLIDDVIFNSGVDPYLVSSSGFSDEQKNEISDLVDSNNIKSVIVASNLDEVSKSFLVSLGVNVKIIDIKFGVPFLWEATGLRQIIRLTPSIVNLDVANPEDGQVFDNLFISGSAEDLPSAKNDLDNLFVLLKSGSLSTPVKEITKESVSSSLGKNFLNNVIWMGIIALLVVGLVIMVHYRSFKIAIPLMFVSLSEVIIILGVVSAAGWAIDLAYAAGILAAVGTGVDSQIIIADELKRGELKVSKGALGSRSKRAYFIILVAALTTIATLLPILINPPIGFIKLRGFALTTITGVLVGVLITRSAFSEIIQSVFSNDNKTKK